MKITDFDEYQRLSATTAKELDGHGATVGLALGLAGEAGEAAEIVKKWWLQDHDLDREALKGELGDQLWYIAGMCTNQSWNLSDIATANREKLVARYPEGFKAEESKKRCTCGHHITDHRLSLAEDNLRCTQCLCMDYYNKEKAAAATDWHDDYRAPNYFDPDGNEYYDGFEPTGPLPGIWIDKKTGIEVEEAPE